MSDQMPDGGQELRVTGDSITGLSQDLRTAQERLGALHVQGVAAAAMAAISWSGAAGKANKHLNDRSNEHLRELRDTMGVLAEMLDMSRGGFDDQEEERLRELRGVQAAVDDAPPSTLKGF